MLRDKTWTVIYRTGGTDNAEWHKVSERFTDYNKALASAMVLERAGYKSLVHRTESLNRIGMPIGWGKIEWLDKACMEDSLLFAEDNN